MNSFCQQILFQVKPDQVEAFEALVSQLRPEQEKQPGCRSVRYMKRFYTFDGVEWGQPPRELTRIVKCVRYYAFLEFDTAADCGKATGWLFDRYAKQIMRLLCMPFEMNSGYEIR